MNEKYTTTGLNSKISCSDNKSTEFAVPMVTISSRTYIHVLNCITLNLFHMLVQWDKVKCH